MHTQSQNTRITTMRCTACRGPDNNRSCSASSCISSGRVAANSLDSNRNRVCTRKTIRTMLIRPLNISSNSRSLSVYNGLVTGRFECSLLFGCGDKYLLRLRLLLICIFALPPCSCFLLPPCLFRWGEIMLSTVCKFK